MSGAPESFRVKLLLEVLVLEDRISAGEAELLETREDMKELMMERRKTKAEKWRDSDIAGASVGCEAVPGVPSSEGENRYLGELEVGVGERVSLGDQGPTSSSGGSQKKRKAEVRNRRQRRNTSRVRRTAWK